MPPPERPFAPPDVFDLCTDMDDLNVLELNGVTASRYKHLYDHDPPFIDHLHLFGKAITLTLPGLHSHLDNKGLQGIFVGYSESLPRDCFRIYNPKTRRTHDTSHVTFLIGMYYLTQAR